MKDLNPLDPRTPLYCIVPPPHHFHVREDLLDELCLSDAYRQFLPRNEAAYGPWLKCVGRTRDELPFASVNRFAGKPYRPTPRYLLTAEIVPGTLYRTNLAIDGNGLPQILPHRGLFHFVIERAIHVCVLKGMPESQARLKLLSPFPRTAPQRRIEAEWAIALEHVGGYCTILVRGAENELRFLSGRDNWRTPFPSG
jgi:hypothetical protein